MNIWIHKSLDFIKLYSKRSIFYKYLKTLTKILIFPFITLIAIIFILHFVTSEKEIRNSFLQNFEKSTSIVENVFNSVENNYLLCASDAHVQNFMVTPLLEFYNSQSYSLQHLKKMLSYMKGSSYYLDSIYLYSKTSNYVFSTGNSNFMPDFDDKAWYDHYKSNDNHQKFILHTKTNSSNILTIGYEVYFNLDAVGVVVFNIDMDVISGKLLNSNKEEESLYIFDKENSLIFSSNNKEIKFDTIISKEFDDSTTNFKNGNKSYIFSKKLDNSDYIIVTEYNISHIQHTGLRIVLFLLLVIILAMILSFFVATYMSFLFYDSISTIMSSFATLGVTISHNTESYDEIKFITNTILQTTTSQLQTEQDLAQKISHLQKAQTVALQTQFTPHFLFNTLNHISVTLMNVLEPKNAASRMITILADLLSVALDTKEYTTNIKNEITYAKKYIELEKIKHDNNFDVVWDIDESLYDYMIPKLILQPILENCLNHGINPLRHKRRGEIYVSVEKQENDILFSIRDNGVGITDERLKEIQSRLKQTEIPETHHIGLCNVHQRIQLLFKDNYGCTIKSTYPGVTVDIRVPCKKF